MAEKVRIQGRVVNVVITPYLTEDTEGDQMIVSEMCISYIDPTVQVSVGTRPKIERVYLDKWDDEQAFDDACALQRGDFFAMEADDNGDETCSNTTIICHPVMPPMPPRPKG